MINRLSRWVPLAGAGYTVLFAVLIFALPGTPDVGDSSTKVLAFYSAHRGAMEVSVYLLAYCAVLAVVFFAAMTSYLRRMGANVLARVAFAGSVIVAVGFGVAAGTTAMLTHKSVTLDSGAAQTLNLINNDLPFIALFVGLLLAMIATGVAIIETKALPAWMGWVAIVAGVGSGIGSFVSWIAMLLSGLWILTASVMLYQRQDDAAMTTSAGGSDRIPAQGQAQTSESGMSIGG